MSSWAEERLVAMVRDETGVHLDPTVGISCGIRLAEVMRSEGHANLDEFVAHLEAQAGQSELRRSSVEALLNNETLFFRDIAFFDMLRDYALPRLIDARRSSRKLRIWSAACSTGQEAYSIAMLIKAHFPQLASWKVEILATDFSRPNLTKARQGCYSQFEVNRGLPAKLLIEHFEKQDSGQWVLSEAIRNAVNFQQLNLLDPWGSVPNADLIIMRNILIYWDIDTKRDILNRVRQKLAPSGLLALGGAETPYMLDKRYSRVGPDRYTCYELVDKEKEGLAG